MQKTWDGLFGKNPGTKKTEWADGLSDNFFYLYPYLSNIRTLNEPNYEYPYFPFRARRRPHCAINFVALQEDYYILKAMLELEESKYVFGI